MNENKRKNGEVGSIEAFEVKRRKFGDPDDGGGGGEDGVDDGWGGVYGNVFPPLRLSRNLWVSATVGVDPSIAASSKEKKFAEGTS